LQALPQTNGTLLALLRLCFIAALWLSAPASMGSDHPTRIGVLSFRDIEATRQQWAPLAEHLNQQISGRRFELVPLHLDDLNHAVEGGKIDFVLTQPEHYVMLRTRHGLAAVATLMPLAGGLPVSRIGGVIVTRNGRGDIRELADLRERTVAAPHQNSLAGYRLQQWTLLQAGINLPDDLKGITFTGQSQDEVIRQVVNNQVDVGFVRTGLIESMIDEGKLDAGAIKVINPQYDPDFPLRRSTALCPEWPFLASGHVPEALVKAVVMALLQIKPDDPAALAGKFYGFSPPADYGALESMLLELDAHPNRLAYFGLRDIIAKYSAAIVASLSIVLLLMLLAVVLLIRSKRRVAAALRERAAMLDSLGEGLYVIDRQGHCEFINPVALEILGLTRQEIVGKDQHRLFHHHRPDGSPYPNSECPIYLTLHDGRKRRGEEWFFRKNGEGFPVRYSVTPLRDRRNEGAVVAFHDISDSRKADEQMRISAIAFETQEAMLVTDAAKRIIRVNRAFTEITGYTVDEVIGQTPAVFKSGHHEYGFYGEMWASLKAHGNWRGEIWNRRKNGEVFPEWLSITAVRNAEGQISHFVASYLDLTQRKEAEEQIQFLAFYDPLTHLPNRRLLNERLEKALLAGARHRRYAALLFIDLDNFKMLNDSMGHAIGDLLLREVAQRLSNSIRANDTVARQGGDEFVILLEELSQDIHGAIAQIKLIAHNMLEALDKPYQFGDVSYHCTASIGAVPFMDTGETVESLLKSADMAMYKAKAAGKNALRFFDPSMQTEIEQRATVERELRNALQAGQFELYFQPQVDSAGSVFGAEALIRWHHPGRGLVGPDEFIRIAEESRLILPIGQWVLTQACRQLALWQKNPDTAHLTLAVNVSALQFRDSDFVNSVARAIAESGAPGSRLKLEITESLLVEDIGGTIEHMRPLKEKLGVGLVLDDFGTGYSSLSYLKQLPLDQIKIDRSFVRDINSDPNDAAIAETIIALGHFFNLTIIAEGVETPAQRDTLIICGCKAFQGFYFGKPGTIEQFQAGLGGNS
jgi:diguanylate cyclase (GGDEF)-like protein/PAS domain S-box-containing protein